MAKNNYRRLIFFIFIFITFVMFFTCFQFNNIAFAKTCNTTNNTMTIFAEGEKFSFTPNLSEIAQKRKYLVGYKGEFLTLIKYCSMDEAMTMLCPNAVKMASILNGKFSKKYSPTKFNAQNGKIEYIEGQSGLEFDKLNFYTTLLETLDKGKTTMCAKFNPVTAESLISFKARTSIKGKFTTSFSTSGIERSHNIKLATEKINGTIVYPNQVFSFNDVVGKRTKENGFKQAKIIMDGEFVLGYGGGVCQVSTTLYNAVLKAGLAAVEVNQHSLPVSYVAPSFDAMVSTRADFKFINTSTKPIYIHSYVENKTVSFMIIGLKGGEVSLKSNIIEIIPYETQFTLDTSLPVGETIVDKQGKNGIRSQGFIEYYEGGKKVTKLIRQNLYKPQKEQIRHNTNLK